MYEELGRLTDAKARNLVIKSLRQTRAYYRKADTAGESLERELDRLIKRKTRINANSLIGINKRYKEYMNAASILQVSLSDANMVASAF